MHHHRLRATRGEVVTLRHCDRDRLMRHRDRSWNQSTQRLRLRERLDDGREIRSGVREQILDTAIRQCAKEVVRDSFSGRCGHGPFVL